MTSEEIKNYKWTPEEIEAARKIAEQQARGDDSQIDYSDIPKLTEEQLSRMVRLRDWRAARAQQADTVK